MPKKQTLEEFIEKSKKKHGNKYDYSKVEYINANTYVIIICSDHGEFKQTPGRHVRHGCKRCVKKSNKCIKHPVYSLQEFLKISKEKHGNYDYSFVDFKNMSTKVKIKCYFHGIFEQLPKDHIRGYGCKKCGIERAQNLRKLLPTFIINKCNELYGNNIYKFLNLDKYINNRTHILMYCNKHNIKFKQNPQHLLSGYISCMYCALTGKKDTNYIIQKLKEKIPENRFDYSLIKYKNMSTLIEVKCLKHQIKFNILPECFLSGQNACKQCIGSKGEQQISYFLEKFEINYIPEKTFKKCLYNSRLRFDFYISDYNCLIEFDGIQHFQKINYHNFDNEYNSRKIKDIIKNKFCLENNIPLLRISYKEYKFIPIIIKSFLNRVKNGFYGIVFSNPKLYKKVLKN